MTDRREVLANWLRACLLDDRANFENRVLLGDTLVRMNALPCHTSDLVDTALLDSEQVDELYAAVRAFADRNPHLGEALRNWEIWHGHAFE